MARRKIIRINESLCNGCSLCINACSEGALKLIDGKARLVREDFCDGFGDCLGECPTGALTIEERESADFDLKATMDHVKNTRGSDGLNQFMAAAQEHGLLDHSASHPAHDNHGDPNGHSSTGSHGDQGSPGSHGGPDSHGGLSVHGSPGGHSGGCPGSRQVLLKTEPKSVFSSSAAGLPGKVLESDLAQWPVQLHLVSPAAPCFTGKELVVLSTCAPVASADVHWRFLRGRSVVVACPKLDRTEPYVEKLAAILSNTSIPAILVVRMTVPCCGGLTRIVDQAIVMSGRTDLKRQEIIVDIDGTVKT